MKNNFLVLAGLSALIFASCSKDKFPPPDKDKYVYDIPQVNLTQDANVGVYYNNISSSYWSSACTGVPTIGQYSSTDAVVMARHIEWADQAGVDFFIFSWNNGTTDTQQIEAFINNVGDAKVKMIINYSTSHLGLSNKEDETLQSDAKITQMMTEFSTILLPYFERDSYFRVDGKPVVMITPLNLSSALLQSANFSLALPSVRSEMKEYGVDMYLIGEFTNGWIAPVNYPEHNISPFEGVTVKDWSTNDFDRRYGYFSFIDLNWQNWRKNLSSKNTDFVPCVFPSYNDKKYTPTSVDYTFGNSGLTADFITFGNVAKRNMGSKRIIFINSWNDFRKGTNLEPTDVNEGNFLDVCKVEFTAK